MKTKNTFQVNIKPPLISLSHSLASDYLTEFHSTPNQSTNKEITKIKTDPKSKTLTIYTKTQTKERKALIENITNNKNWQIIQNTIEEELTNNKIGIAKEERANVLGITELQSRFLDLPNFLSAQQKRMLTFYLPYAQQIKQDIKLLANLLFSLTEQQVKLKLLAPKKTEIEGIKVSSWIVGASNEVGGKKSTNCPLLQIKIGPLENGEIADYVKEGHWRRFLEAAIYPQFIPKDWDWETQIICPKEQQQFTVSDDTHELRIGINSFVV